MTAKAPAGGAAAVSTTIVAERVPLKLLKMETVEEYFSRFGALAHIEIDRARHQAIIDFEEHVDAQTAVSSKEPIMDEPTVYLRFFRGSRPHPYAPRQDPPAPPPVNLPTALLHATDGNRGGGGSHVHSHGTNIVLDNLVMESCDASLRRQEREESQIKKKELMQKITDKMKTVMVRLTDSNLREDQKDQLQDLLMSLKKQLTSLTTPIGSAANPANPAVPGAAQNNASSQGGPPGMAPNQVLDLRSKVVRIEFKQETAGLKEKGDGDDKDGDDKDGGKNGEKNEDKKDDDDLLKSGGDPTAALKKMCSEVDWASNELTVAWDDSQASEEGASKTKAIIVTFPDRRTAEHALGDLPRNLVSATFI